ncbi:uncharacterized protein [Ptychodera flava]|uniref:uncharacterized protein n=1 Tax=Ptychodera flava TaxID=63121 RepID=UPI00396A6B9B
MKTLKRDIKTELNEVRKDLASMNGSVSTLKENYQKLAEENKILRQRFDRVELSCDKLRGHSGRNNLIFQGIPENVNGRETWEECQEKVRNMLKNELDIENAFDESAVPIERAHRLPDRFAGNSPRRVIVNFLSYQVRSSILQKGRTMLRDSTFKVKEDFSPAIRATRRKLAPYMRKALDDGKRATLIYDTLLIDGVRYKFDEVTQNIVKL